MTGYFSGAGVRPGDQRVRPQFPQNFFPGVTAVPQEAQNFFPAAAGDPHEPQNCFPARTGDPQEVQKWLSAP